MRFTFVVSRILNFLKDSLTKVCDIIEKNHATEIDESRRGNHAAYLATWTLHGQ